MDARRLYIDSKDRTSGTATDFIFQVNLEMDIKEDSVAILDTVLIPVSWYVVEAGDNDRIYMSETRAGNIGHFIALIEQGYYKNYFEMATAIQKALNDSRVMVTSPYVVTFNTKQNRCHIDNPWTGLDEVCYIYSKYSLTQFISPSIWGASIENLQGAFTQIGMVTGSTVFGGQAIGGQSLVLNDMPALQTHRQLFVGGNLGIPGVVQGPGDNIQEVLRRVAITAPFLSMNLDRATSYYDTIRIAPGTITSLKLWLLGEDGKRINLHGLDWSFSLMLFPRGNFPFLA